VILVDAGPLIAAFDSSDEWHEECAALLQDLAGPLIVPPTVVAEVCHMVARFRFGADLEAAFLRSMADGNLQPATLEPADYERMAELVEQYADLKLGGSDASVIALAERLNIRTLLTLDRRHFGVVVPRHVPAFELLPDQSVPEPRQRR
jgi:predicted nucleic acid-binding protein